MQVALRGCFLSLSSFCTMSGSATVKRMLSRTRILALLALMVGVALVIAGILLPKMVSSEHVVPLELKATTLRLQDPQATVGSNYRAGEEGDITAPVARQFNISLGEPATEDQASARVGVSTYREDTEDDLKSLLDAQVFSFRVDRITGQAVDGAGKVADTPVVPSSEVAMEGYWAKLPANAERTTYDYFDVTLRTALPAEFNREETRTASDGTDMPVYVYRQEIEPRSVREQYQGIRNEITDPESGETAQLMHGGWREITVEPKSGLIVGVEEDIRDTYQLDGKEIQTLLAFHGRTYAEDELQMLQQAQSVGTDKNISTWRTILLAAGALVIVISLVLVFRRSNSRGTMNAQRGEAEK